MVDHMPGSSDTNGRDEVTEDQRSESDICEAFRSYSSQDLSHLVMDPCLYKYK